ncbi:MAG TPA: hypothetical protein VMT82_07295 [candidate division Zixibacteria bacterium]|nr:hypothetical protein [candidate division Zixibacteria bacterium]
MERIARHAITLVVISALTAVSCRHKKDEIPPTPLGCGLESVMSQAKVERKLNVKSSEWEVVEDRRPLSTDTRPMFHILTISHKGATCGGDRGELQLTFFNDRLMYMQFYADDFDAARNAAGLNPHTGDTHIPPNTRAWAGRSEDRRQYLGWMDLLLKREYDDWINTYER